VCPLTPRWTELAYHPEQARLFCSAARFRVVAAGRRSGKTELAKRFMVMKALQGGGRPDARFFAAAPTRDQAKRIFWDDLKRLVPPGLTARVREQALTLDLVNGARLAVLGMDRPERVEGAPWDGGVLDEFADMKERAFSAHVRPALSDRRGWCWLIGVPEGRNHFWRLFCQAREDASGEWAAFHWKSADILPEAEIAAARRDLDPRTFEQEYEAGFLHFEGRAYYCFDPDRHCAPLSYDPAAPLVLCFDFNVSPGVAVACQEGDLPCGSTGTRVVGEVHIPRDSNTRAVCRELARLFAAQCGPVACYGDASGGARASAKVCGSDWDLVREELTQAFGRRLSLRVPKANPAERARLNAVNTRLLSGAGEVRLMLDPTRAPNLARDLEGVRLDPDGSGRVDKAADPALTHLSDALGYYLVREFPAAGRVVRPVAVMG